MEDEYWPKNNKEHYKDITDLGASLKGRLRLYSHMKRMNKDRMNWQIFDQIFNLKNIKAQSEQIK